MPVTFTQLTCWVISTVVASSMIKSDLQKMWMLLVKNEIIGSKLFILMNCVNIFYLLFLFSSYLSFFILSGKLPSS